MYMYVFPIYFYHIFLNSYKFFKFVFKLFYLFIFKTVRNYILILFNFEINSKVFSLL